MFRSHQSRDRIRKRRSPRALGRASDEWVLAIDADERVTPKLAASICAAIESKNSTTHGYFIEFLATWCGKPVRFGDWAGKRHLRLFRRGYAQFSDDVVHERVICRPPTATLEGLMIHDTVASRDEAMEKCHRYARLSAQTLAAQGRGGLLPALLHSAWGMVFHRMISDSKPVRACGPWSLADCALPRSENRQAPHEQRAGGQRPRHSSHH
jgi:hypothetical protein